MTATSPIILEPAGMTAQAGWAECRSFVDQCGGVTYPDGEVNWRAAFGADPGVCSCPACHQMYWAWGTKQRCVVCGFEYPTDWWPMYSYGVGTAKMHIPPDQYPFIAKLHQQRLEHPYYRYGFEHPVADAWLEHDRIDWRSVMTDTRHPGAR